MGAAAVGGAPTDGIHCVTDAQGGNLARYKGVGTKTISCVLMFCLGREDFPVDTHASRQPLFYGIVTCISLLLQSAHL